MADEESSSGTDPEQKQLNSPPIFPAYTLYRYHANRPKEASNNDNDVKPDTKSNQANTGGQSEPSVADFLHKEAKVDGNFRESQDTGDICHDSLSVVATSLSAENETELRKFIAKKLSRGTVYSGHGNLSSLELHVPDGSVGQATCYYCLLRKDSDAALLDLAPSCQAYCSNEFVVCFMSSVDVSLDLFKQELDKYSSELLVLLDADLPILFDIEDQHQLSDLESKVKPFLSRWPEDVMYYLCRCVTRLNEDLAYLIYASLVDWKINILGTDEQIQTDIKKFVECCSLSELLSQIKNEASTPMSDNGNLLVNVNLEHYTDSTSFQQQSLTLTLEPNSHKFDKQECNKFCDDWARALVMGDSENPVFLRQVIDNYRLKAIQDMNTLKRLIRQAETDYYALYRSYVFLKNSGNGSILLQHAHLEHHSLTSPDARHVLAALENFIQETGGFPAR